MRFFAIAIVPAVCGLLLNNRDEYAPFHPLSDGYTSMDVVYVIGPFAEEADGERTSRDFFIAEAPDQMWYVVSTNPNADLPIYGEDISDADIANLTAQTAAAPHGWDNLYYLAIIMALLSLVLFVGGNKQRKKAKLRLNELEANGQLSDIYDDFASNEQRIKTADRIEPIGCILKDVM